MEVVAQPTSSSGPCPGSGPGFDPGSGAVFGTNSGSGPGSDPFPRLGELWSVCRLVYDGTSDDVIDCEDDEWEDQLAARVGTLFRIGQSGFCYADMCVECAHLCRPGSITILLWPTLLRKSSLGYSK